MPVPLFQEDQVAGRVLIRGGTELRRLAGPPGPQHCADHRPQGPPAGLPRGGPGGWPRRDAPSGGE
eukprot:3741328-Alexandrium_andersonii.AAC.1